MVGLSYPPAVIDALKVRLVKRLIGYIQSAAKFVLRKQYFVSVLFHYSDLNFSFLFFYLF